MQQLQLEDYEDDGDLQPDENDIMMDDSYENVGNRKLRDRNPAAVTQ